jgi:hypothetical protein
MAQAGSSHSCCPRSGLTVSLNRGSRHRRHHRIREIILCTAPAAKRLSITDLLQVVEPAGNAAIAGAVEGIERNRCAP